MTPFRQNVTAYCNPKSISSFLLTEPCFHSTHQMGSTVGAVWRLTLLTKRIKGQHSMLSKAGTLKRICLPRDTAHISTLPQVVPFSLKLCYFQFVSDKITLATWGVCPKHITDMSHHHSFASHLHAYQCRRGSERVRYPETRTIGHCRCWEPSPRPLQKQNTLLTTEPPLHPPNNFCFLRQGFPVAKVSKETWRVGVVGGGDPVCTWQLTTV